MPGCAANVFVEELSSELHYFTTQHCQGLQVLWCPGGDVGVHGWLPMSQTYELLTDLAF